ncbi:MULTISPECIES: hemagglutinin repeat-containing protein [Photorhabdus]|uniref:Hemolysin phla protein n=2 Tax=Photorhabdus asymbiotica TaxID=291112 RepID=B6VM45_PHOAA|nr:hemagglutinin repeat-containing protein [Photorhabdus asymbiotica]RKS54500.1 S-PFT family hemolysin [Photorhabdus asymbiotica]CAQ82338.1 hemolysin phla protein [Photorhabdus asymbiotica]CAR67225.1 hemolysin phla protein [Photorhabdus asymbiotica subsp. asymbiotica ATCC 43949]
MKNKKFKLSPTGKLAASMAIILVSCSTSFANDIVGGGDSAHRPDILAIEGKATVINIVPPSPSGLSHNQYLDYNVGHAGAVLNNALQDGQSQLAGQLAANPNLNGQAASLILNEVISRNPSLLLGQQEVFGIAADYVLANPNGITCNGCGFINTNQASLVVGNPLVEQGNLQSFNTFNNQNGLKIKSDGLTANAVLNLIAPKIDNRGTVTAQKQINAISGANKISATRDVIDSQQELTGVLDSYYLGSMQAGRIHLLNTAKGSGVNLQGSLTASNEIIVDAHGNLNLEAAHLQGGNIDLLGDNIEVKGKVSESKYNRDGSNNYQSYFRSVYTNDSKNSQSITRTKLAGKNISLVANNNHQITATDIVGDDVNLSGANLTLDGQQLNQSTKNIDNQRGYSWRYEVTKESEKQHQAGNNIQAKKNVVLNATEGDVKILGSKIDAKDKLAITAKKGVQIAGLTETEKTSETGYKKNHTAKLQTGSWEESKQTQRLIASELQAGTDLNIKAGTQADILGAKVHAGQNMTVTAGQQLQIDVQKISDNRIVRDDKKYWGGIGGGGNKDNSELKETSHASELTANGRLLLSGQEGISITGSKVKADQGAFVDANSGKLTIDNAVSHLNQKIDERTGTVFNITNSSQKTNSKQQKSHGSELVSEADLKLLGDEDFNIIGSQVKSAGALNLKTAGNIKVLSYGEQQQVDKQNTSLDLQSHFQPKADKQYRAGVGIEHTSNSQKNQTVIQKASTLSGGSITLDTDKDVILTGSNLVTTKGDAKISGANVHLLAAEGKKSEEKFQSNKHVGVYLTGGIDKVGSGIYGGYEGNNSNHTNSTAVVSGSQIAGDLNIKANGELIQEGTDHKVSGTYTAEAGKVSNLATSNTESHSNNKLQVGTDIGVNIDYSAVTRPVEKAVKDPVKAALDGTFTKKGTPNLGADLAANGNNIQTEDKKSEAVVTSVQASNVVIKTNGELYDQGTQYHANKGNVTLEAGNHTSEAAQNRHESRHNETSGKADLRVYTTTGEDISANGKGKGGTQSSYTATTQSVTSKITAENDINIRVDRDAEYQGTSLDAKTGKTNIDAGGDIRFDHAANSTTKTSTGYHGEASAKGGNSPEGKNIHIGLGGGYNTDSKNSSTAQVSKIDGQQGVNLNAGNHLTLKGSEVTGKQIDLKAKQGNVELVSAQDRVNNDGWEFNLKGNGGHSNSVKKAEDDSTTTTTKQSFGGELKAGVDRLQATTHHNSHIKGENVVINSGGDTTISGARIDADQVTGNIGGDLRVESRKDTEHGLNVGVDAGLNYAKESKVKSDDLPKDEATKDSPPQDDSSKDDILKDDPTKNPTEEPQQKGLQERLTSAFNTINNLKGINGVTGKFKGNVDIKDRESVSEQSVISGNQGVNLDVKGNTHLVGGQIGSEKGNVILNTQNVEQQSVTGYDNGKGGNIALPDSVSGIVKAVQEGVLSGKIPLVKTYSNETENGMTNGEIINHKSQ